MNRKEGGLPFSFLLMIVLFIIIVTVFLAGIWMNYENSKNNAIENAERLRIMTGSHINNSFRMIDTGLKLYDNTYNSVMRDAFVTVMDEYTRKGGDPSRMDLSALKREIGGMDIHVINEDCVIVYSSSPVDLGLDFAAIYPDFCEYLHRIRNTSGYYPDRVVMEWFNGTLTKYAYMPAPDHRYILELGMHSDRFSMERMDLQYSDVVDEVREFNPYLDEVLLFQKQKRLLYDMSYVPTLRESEMLDYILWENRTTQVVREPESGKTIVWQVIDLRDPDYAADMSIFAKLTYNDELLARELQQLALMHGFAAVLVVLSGGLIAIMISRKISRPIESLVGDVNTIAGGDLDHPIGSAPGSEFTALSESIQVMVNRLKEKMRECKVSEERFMDLVNLLPLGIFETDLSGNVIFANPTAFDVFAYTPDEIPPGFNIMDVIAPKDRQRAHEVFNAILAGKKSEGTEYTGLRQDGSCFPIMVYTSTRAEEGVITGVRGTIVDITRLKQGEAEIRKLNFELEDRVTERTAKLEDANREMEAFTYSVSHDLKAPLRAIDGFSQILEKTAGLRLDEKERHCISVVRQNVKLMDSLINGLLALSRMGRQKMKREWLFPEPMVRDLAAEMTGQYPGRKVTVTIGELPWCFADPLMLRQVFVNLIDNAVKFSRDIPDPLVEVGSFRRDSQTVFFVRDNGAGFDMKYIDQIFKPFHQLNRPDDYEGSGIGLTIVHRIIQRHGGKIWAESEPGKGSTFFFTLESDDKPPT